MRGRWGKVVWTAVGLSAAMVVTGGLFKTDAELTLAAYNAGVQHGIPMALAVTKGTGPTTHLVGMGELSDRQVMSLYEQATRPPKYLEIPVKAALHTMERRMGITLQELMPLLLSLAKAAREGRFANEYARLLPQGLLNLIRLFAGGFASVDEAAADPTVQRYVRELALECERQLTGGLQPVSGSGGVIEIITTVQKLYAIAKAVYEALVAFHRVDPRPVFGVVKLLTRDPQNPVFLIERDVGSYRVGWNDIRAWYEPAFRAYGVPFPYRVDWESTLGAYAPAALELNPVGFALIALGYQCSNSNLYRKAQIRDEQRVIFHYFLKTFAFMHDAKDQGWLPAAVTVLAADNVQLVMYKDRGWTNAPEFPDDLKNIPVKDIAVVEYRDRLPDEELLARLDSLVSTFRKPQWDSARIANSATYGVDLAAVVFSRKITPLEEDTIQKFIDLVENRFPFRENPDIPPQFREQLRNKIGAAIAVVWQVEGSDTVMCHWHDVGPIPTTVDHRRKMIADLIRVPEERVRFTNEPRPVTSPQPRPSESSRPMYSAATVSAGGLWMQQEQIYPVSLP